MRPLIIIICPTCFIKLGRQSSGVYEGYFMLSGTKFKEPLKFIILYSKLSNLTTITEH